MSNLRQLKSRPLRSIQPINLNDKELFGNVDAQKESQGILNSFFLTKKAFDSFLDTNNPFYLVSARKGMGKSALLSFFGNKLRQNQENVVIKTKGTDIFSIDKSEELNGKNHFYLQNFWKKRICKTIIIEIVNQIGFAGTDLLMKIFESLEEEDFLEKNIIGAIISRLEFALKIPNAEFKMREKNIKNWESVLKQYQKKYLKSDVWLLIDDIDDGYTDTDDHSNLIICFFSSIANLSYEIENINIRATVRTDVWNSLRKHSNFDKIRPFVTSIDWKEDDLKTILIKRIITYAERIDPHSREAQYDLKTDSEEILSIVFNESKTLWTNYDIEINKAVIKYSNQVPRAMIELCIMSAQKAYEKNFPKIGRTAFDKTLKEFGQNRISDIVKEHKYQFDDLMPLIYSFRSGSRYYKYSELIDFLEEKYLTYLSKDGHVPDIDRYSYQYPHQLAEFLYKIGFFSARIAPEYKSEINLSGDIRFQDEPDFFSTVENRENKIMWSIHPTYRKGLSIK